ncbi:EamA family transporter [Marinifilum sp. N1E240]|uniref:DMT family transporter n=1 Tax=Marinifilum sp. N1E240 TaxID=2608082 RepID=UPI00128BC4F8|nr:DMT family transporter [Marinifilum sp. N1E240]MPQ45644.1 EamA family transporter [Marinifilum sp. N1E240]
MRKTGKLKGSILALLATISFSNVYIFSKLAMEDISLVSFGILWFGLALLYNYLYYVFFTERKKLSSLPKKSKSVLLLIGCSEVISIFAFFLSIQLTENPAIVSFLANTSPIFVILISFFFLGSRYRPLALIGMLITFLGVGLINFNNGGFDWQSLTSKASISAIIFAIFYGVSLVLARSEIRNIPAAMITVSRNLFLFIGFILYAIFLMEMPYYTTKSIMYVGLGSFFGPFMGIVLTFASLKYVDASITTLIGTLRSVFIIGGAYLFMNILPNSNQLIGGTLTILGILIITFNDIKTMRNTH